MKITSYLKQYHLIKLFNEYRLKYTFTSVNHLCSYIKIINRMIAIKQPKTNTIFPFLEWNILILFGLYLIESMNVPIDTANNPKDPSKINILNLSYLLNNVPTA